MDQRSPADERGFAALAESKAQMLRLCPTGMLRGRSADVLARSGSARWLAGGSAAFTHIKIRLLGHPPELVALADLAAFLAQSPDQRETVTGTLERICSPRPDWARFALDRTRIMGIVNATPDSFSDSGGFLDPLHAIAHGRALLEAGADAIDVGGESTRPGAQPVGVEEELRRVIPVIRGLVDAGATVSVDTRRATVMAAALAAGARIVNDVTALMGDPQSLAVVARSDAAVVLMHMQGEPATMQRDPRYEDVVLEVCDFLEARVAACERAGIARSRLLVDPGIGFGKTLAHNLDLLAHLGALHGLGVGAMLGVSRKSFIARASRGETPEHRLAGSLAAAVAAMDQGVQWLRVHDVAETCQAVTLKNLIDSTG